MKEIKKEKQEIIDKLTSKTLKQKKSRYNRRLILWEITIKISFMLKRFLDIIFCGIFLIVFSPIFVFTALCIIIENPGPIFYGQIRVGKDGRHFDFYKFRSMVVGADKMKDDLLQQNESGDGVIFKMKKDPRITKTGRIIRRFSIDELPQLINVLKGDMSLVGPRPPLPREVAEYTLEDRKRLHIIPGITCIWQVSGRSEIPFDEQVLMDKKYILESKSIFKDIALLFRTAGAVFGGKGAY